MISEGKRKLLSRQHFVCHVLEGWEMMLGVFFFDLLILGGPRRIPDRRFCCIAELCRGSASGIAVFGNFELWLFVLIF